MNTSASSTVQSKPTSEPESFRNGRQFAWDATSLELAQTCLRKYQLKMIEGWSPKSLSVHLLFGQLYATALENFYKARALGASIDEALRQVVHEALEGSWDRTTNEPMEFEHAAKTRANLVRSIVWYVDEFAEESADGVQTYVLKNGKPAVELSFTLELDKDVLLCGHLDRVVTYGDEQYVMDQKTTGTTIGSRWFEQFSPHMQMSLYSFAGRAVFHVPIRGVIIDGAQIAVGFTRFTRGFTFRTEMQLEEWHQQVKYIIAAADRAADTGYYPMNTAACGNYGGCEFRRICSRAPSVRENFLRGDFTRAERWDPLKRR